MDRAEKKFNRILNNYYRYRFYGKEAKVALKLVRRLEESFSRAESQTEQFLNQLVRLCTCKSDNVLLRRLGLDVALVSSDLRRANSQHKETFTSLVTQLTQISEQFDGMEKVEAKYKAAHCNRVSYEHRPKGLVNVLARVFSIRAHRSDDEFIDVGHLQNDYLDNYTDKPVDRKLARLVKEEASLEQALVNDCLNQELATVIRIRKLIRTFAENQVQHERDLILLFSQLDMIADQDVPEMIMSLNHKELDEYFRPNNARSRMIMPSFYSGDQPGGPPATATSKPPAGGLLTDRPANVYGYKPNVAINAAGPRPSGENQKSYSLDSHYKNQVMNKLISGNPQHGQSGQQKQPNPPIRSGLYYGSLCSLNDKNFVCELCNPAANANVDALMNETSYHRCKLSHGQEKPPNEPAGAAAATTAFNPDELTNIDLNASHISPSASAPPADVSEWPVKSNGRECNALQQFCKICNGHCYQLCKVEEAALAFLASYRNFKSQIGNLEFKDVKQMNDQLPSGF